MDLDQPGTTTKLVNMISVAYVPGRTRNLLSTRKAVKHWGKPFVYCKTKAVLGFPGEESLVYNFYPRKRLDSATSMRRTPTQGAALALAEKMTEAIRVETTGQSGLRSDIRRSASQGAALALAAKTAETMRAATDQWGPCADARRSPRRGLALAVAAKARDVMKVPQALADFKEETREVPLDPEEETREVPLDPEDGTREVPLDPKEGTRKVPLDSKEKTHEAPSDPKEQTLEALSDAEEETLEVPSDSEEKKDVAGFAAGSIDLEGLIVPTHWKFIISGNLPSNNIIPHVEFAGARRRGRSSTTKLSAHKRGRRLRQCVDVWRREHDEFAEAKYRELHPFDAEEAFLNTSASEEIYT